MTLDSYFYARNEADRIPKGFMALRNAQHREQMIKNRCQLASDLADHTQHRFRSGT